jgi:uncharacterized protein YcfJ
MKRLDKMSLDVLGQMAATPVIHDSMSKGMKKIGAVALIGLSALLTSGVAHADNTLNLMTGLSGAAALLMDGNKPDDVRDADCNVQGKSGWKVAGAGVTGAFAGNQIGKGSGKKWATALGGLVVAGAVNNKENERMREDCARQINERQAREAQQARSTAYYTPAYYGNPVQAAMPTAPILYSGQTRNGGVYYVTTQNSPGLQALMGKQVGAADVTSDPVVNGAMQKSANNLRKDYVALEQASIKYQSILSGSGSTTAKMSRYAADLNESQAMEQAAQQTRQGTRDQLARVQAAYEQAFQKYAISRSFFANIADNAATDGYNITGYAEMVNYMSTPQAALIREPDGSIASNRFASVPNAIK